MQIDHHKTIITIQEEFSAVFPNLRLEFFSKPYRQGGAALQLTKHHSKTLNECRIIHGNKTINYNQATILADLDYSFRMIYGLRVQFLKRLGDSWQEIMGDEKLSLGELNSK